jgi:hypothetical protein
VTKTVSRGDGVGGGRLTFDLQLRVMDRESFLMVHDQREQSKNEPHSGEHFMCQTCDTEDLVPDGNGFRNSSNQLEKRNFP